MKPVVAKWEIFLRFKESILATTGSIKGIEGVNIATTGSIKEIEGVNFPATIFFPDGGTCVYYYYLGWDDIGTSMAAYYPQSPSLTTSPLIGQTKNGENVELLGTTFAP